jgi:enoyl-CoA hydratase/carnithine racemase
MTVAEDLLYTVENHVATIRLNRPERKNAFTLEMLDEWADALRNAEADPAVRVVVLTGAGDSFCSGVDLSAYNGREKTPLSEKELLTKHVHQVAYAAEALSKPYLAAVNGVAVGAGMDMSLMCDLRFASDQARFSEGYIRIGVVPGDGGCFFLPPLVGTATALRLLWTGDWVDASEALRIGLVSEVYRAEELTGQVAAFAATLAGKPPVAVQLIKKAVRTSSRADLRTALDLISSHQAVATSTRDSREAMSAFREKRSATFEGR